MGSTAIAADRAHYLMDAVLNGGVLAALVLSRVTGWERADAVIALIMIGHLEPYPMVAAPQGKDACLVAYRR
jgi:hypothetical protein